MRHALAALDGELEAACPQKTVKHLADAGPLEQPRGVAATQDGVDGQEEIAGAYAGPATLERARQLGIRARDSLADNDGHGFFQALDDSVVCGPTLTNVNDFRAILVEG